MRKQVLKNRLPVCLFVASIILLAFMSQTNFSSGAVSTSASLSSYGTIGSIQDASFMKHIMAYWYPPSNGAFIASHFNFVFAQFDSIPVLTTLKTLNPGLTIFGYKDIMGMDTSLPDWAEVNSHEDWFLHDTSGRRIQQASWGWYAMDVGNSGWRSHYANFVKTKMNNAVYDGLLADDVWAAFPATGASWNPWTVPLSSVPASIANRWYNDMVGMISYVKATIAPKLFIVNTGDDDDYVSAADGKMEEEFVHADWWASDQFYDSYADWEGKVGSLQYISSIGKYYIAQSGTVMSSNPTQSEKALIRKIMLYCYTSFLLGFSGNTATYGFGSAVSNDGSSGYYSEMDVALGAAINDYYPFQSVYTRDFTSGKVLVNPATTSRLVNLGAEYRMLDGQVVTTITLNPHSGVILLNQ